MKRKQLSQREEQILLLLQNYDFLTRDQINRYFRLGTVRNTNKILGRLSDYLLSIREGYQSIYYLSKDGRAYVGCEKIRKKGGHIQHIIMRNEFWLFYKCPPDWKSEIKVSDGQATIIVDAMFTRNGFQHFLEVDNLQTLQENREKIKRYKVLMNSLVKQYGYYPTLVWVTTTEYRRKQLEKACEGIKVKVYTIDDFK